MTNDTIAAFLAALDADPTLRERLGGPDRIRFGHLSQHERIPGIYLSGGDTNTSEPGFGYQQSGLRDAAETVQIDVWAFSPELAGDLADRLDPVVFTGLRSLRRLRRAGGMAPKRDPDRRDLFHATARYAFEYRIRDTP
jgi:hypothetical protein